MARRNILWIAVCLFISRTAFAGSPFKAFEGKHAPSSGKQVLVPEQYHIFTVDQQGLDGFLSGLSADPAAASVLSLPQPDGTYRDFHVWKTTMMEEPLPEKYPGIQTFTAVAVDNKNVTAKLDGTPKGFHAMIFDGDRTFLIDPYSNIPDGYYTVYYKKDYKRNLDQMLVCEGEQDQLPDASGNLPEPMDGGLPPVALKQYGSTRKTFRLALSCTGQYAQAVGGASPATATVLGAMVTSMNRVNGIYERELSVTMVLIGNNDLLVYLDPATDPFNNNNNGNGLLGENQNNTTAVIGSANYDIGHIFSTGGGGVAIIGCVCKDNLKARGVTGASSPIGDAYDVDYVAHEMGHQFGSNHTFNKCSNTEYAPMAYEPGSGSTVMAYAGICGQYNNLQQHSNDYFHAISLDKISDFLTNEATCAVNDDQGAAMPILPSISNTYAIPYLTPFELMAPEATILENDTFNYCWEEWDLGNFQQVDTGSANFTTGPVFRSITPTVNRLRVFPKTESLINNITSAMGEHLPAVARNLNFKVIARNVKNGFGTFNISDEVVTLNVINTGEPFKVTSPDLSTVEAYALAPQMVTWNVAQTDVAPVNTPHVDIFLSVDGGYTYPFTLASGVPNNGSALVVMPDTSSNTARIKVKGSGNVFFDISNANFKLTDTISPLSVAGVQLNNDLSVYPNPAKTQLNITHKGQSSLIISLYNTVGQELWQGTLQQKISIPVDAYARGIYYLRISDRKNGSKTVKRFTLQ